MAAKSDGWHLHKIALKNHTHHICEKSLFLLEFSCFAGWSSFLMYSKVNHTYVYTRLGFPGGTSGKGPAYKAGDTRSIPGLGRPPGGGHRDPVQHSCLENCMDRGAWRATVHRIAETRLKRLSAHAWAHCSRVDVLPVQVTSERAVQSLGCRMCAHQTAVLYMLSVVCMYQSQPPSSSRDVIHVWTDPCEGKQVKRD